MHSQSLFLVSTPLHLLVSLAIIGKEQLKSPLLIFIDQDPSLEEGFRRWLQDWPENPFDSIDTLFRPPKTIAAKGKARKEAFKFIAHYLSDKSIKHIYVGNDRRVEFQYAMHIASSKTADVTGFYMDEGIFTYAGRDASKSFSDRCIDGTIKKLVYGWWWTTPTTIGASHWISDVYASMPEFVHPELKQKNLIALDDSYWKNPLLQSFCAFALAHSMKDAESILASIDVLITFPHESILHSEKFDRELLQRLINHYSNAGATIAVKYHPRDKEQDALKLAPMINLVLPQSLPFEAMLPCLPNDLKLFGELSTPLVTAKLLRPGFEVSTFSQVSEANELQRLFEKLGIKPLSLA